MADVKESCKQLLADLRVVNSLHIFLIHSLAHTHSTQMKSLSICAQSCPSADLWNVLSTN